MSEAEITRGDLYWVDWRPARGSEQAGRRPALVVQADAGNRSPKYLNTIVVAVSTASARVPTHVEIQPTDTNGLRSVFSVECEQLFTIAKARLQAYIGTVDARDLSRVDAALRRVLALS